jgi:hypothetical protein
MGLYVGASKREIRTRTYIHSYVVWCLQAYEISVFTLSAMKCLKKKCYMNGS